MERRTLLIVGGLIALAAIGWIRSGPPDMKAVRKAAGDEPVVLLSASWCGYCKKLRGDLESWRVRYVELDVENDPTGRRVYGLARAHGVPLMLVGEQLFEGYQPGPIHQAIADAGLLPATVP
ncbi:glutaredoxin domain-containing protein [Dokdonella sp.]|uniref:glutaredoxin domain-containing protein n=1 Tax=Dokdonella sp. TaxID=2291710 RepID=UPI0025BDCE38|nr:glutaredoxin domain-containing protein [Dokdonella sp.]MBX3690336.1 hypothetical protein [Dokdonella sp.]